jgi:3-hydroxymyristoyl/3-hydroxydecanoyl-(acyl carrier protein) dehydratase
MELDQFEMTSLIPQRPPFMMVDKILSCDDTDAVTEFLVRQDNILLDGNQLSSAGIVENMAQSCAARMGCVNLLHNRPIKLGFIGEIKNLKINRQPMLNDHLITEVHILMDVFDMTLASVYTKVNGEVIAEARMKLASTDIEAEG